MDRLESYFTTDADVLALFQSHGAEAHAARFGAQLDQLRADGGDDPSDAQVKAMVSRLEVETALAPETIGRLFEALDTTFTQTKGIISDGRDVMLIGAAPDDAAVKLTMAHVTIIAALVVAVVIYKMNQSGGFGMGGGGWFNMGPRIPQLLKSASGAPEVYAIVPVKSLT